MGHRGTTGIHHRTEVKRSLEGTLQAPWTRGIQTQLEDDQARTITIVQELNAAQVKAQPDIERRKDTIDGEIHRSLKDRAIAAQGMLNAIDEADMTRLQRSQRARGAVGSGDPDLILATILAHLTALAGQETRGDVVCHLKAFTQASSAAKGDSIWEHMNAFRDALQVSQVLLRSLPGEPSQEKREFQEKFNEAVTTALAIMSLDEKTQLLRRRWEGTVNPETLAGYTFGQYVYGLTALIQHKPPGGGCRRAAGRKGHVGPDTENPLSRSWSRGRGRGWGWGWSGQVTSSA